MRYFQKMKGSAISPPRVSALEIFWSWLEAFLGIGAVSYIHFTMFDGLDAVMLIGSLGASAVLIYGAVKSPLTQPRIFLGGHLLSAAIGLTCYKLFPDQLRLASSLSVTTAIAGMLATKTLHPPGGATALIAVIGSQKIHQLGYLYLIMPVGFGTLLMLVVVLLVNNIPEKRSYPEFWI